MGCFFVWLAGATSSVSTRAAGSEARRDPTQCQCVAPFPPHSPLPTRSTAFRPARVAKCEAAVRVDSGQTNALTYLPAVRAGPASPTTPHRKAALATCQALSFAQRRAVKFCFSWEELR
jgi:hypothetical protein